MGRTCRLFMLRPPYLHMVRIEPNKLASENLDGSAVIWGMGTPTDQGLSAVVRSRSPSVSLLVMLPPADEIRRTDDILDMLERGRPHSVLPYHPEHRIEEWVSLLRRTPANLPSAVTDFLEWRGLEFNDQTRHLAREIIARSAEIRTISKLSRKLYMSRRALGRRFHAAALPPPSHWLQFSRTLRVCLQLQANDETVAVAARRLGYPDGFSFSNQMVRLVGVRPALARETLGWEWLADRWITRALREVTREGPAQVGSRALHA